MPTSTTNAVQCQCISPRQQWPRAVCPTSYCLTAWLEREHMSLITCLLFHFNIFTHIVPPPPLRNVYCSIWLFLFFFLNLYFFLNIFKCLFSSPNTPIKSLNIICELSLLHRIVCNQSLLLPRRETALILICWMCGLGVGGMTIMWFWCTFFFFFLWP